MIITIKVNDIASESVTGCKKVTFWQLSVFFVAVSLSVSRGAGERAKTRGGNSEQTDV